jgi:hypothetical protein
MCQSIEQGGRRCAAHTREPALAVLAETTFPPGPKSRAETEAVVAFASTPTGYQELVALTNADDNPDRIAFVNSCLQRVDRMIIERRFEVDPDKVRSGMALNPSPQPGLVLTASQREPVGTPADVVGVSGDAATEALTEKDVAGKIRERDEADRNAFNAYVTDLMIPSGGSRDWGSAVRYLSTDEGRSHAEKLFSSKSLTPETEGELTRLMDDAANVGEGLRNDQIAQVRREVTSGTMSVYVADTAHVGEHVSAEVGSYVADNAIVSGRAELGTGTVIAGDAVIGRSADRSVGLVHSKYAKVNVRDSTISGRSEVGTGGESYRCRGVNSCDRCEENRGPGSTDTDRAHDVMSPFSGTLTVAESEIRDATVASIGEIARSHITDGAIIGRSFLDDSVVIRGSEVTGLGTTVKSSTITNSEVRGGAVLDGATITDSVINGPAKIMGTVNSSRVSGNVEVRGSVSNSDLSGTVRCHVDPRAHRGRRAHHRTQACAGGRVRRG